MGQFIFWLAMTMLGFVWMTVSGYHAKDNWDKIHKYEKVVSSEKDSQVNQKKKQEEPQALSDQGLGETSKNAS